MKSSDQKPIRIFLQDGLNDNRGSRRDGGYDATWDWVHAEPEDGGGADGQRLRRELLGHWNPLQQTGRRDDAKMLRWLWRDYPRPDDPADDSNRKLLPAVSPAP